MRMIRVLLLVLLVPAAFLAMGQGSGQSLSFNGANQLVSVASLSPNIGNSDFTVECYANFSSFANFGGVITSFSSNTGGWAIHQQIGGTLSFLIGVNASSGNFEQVSTSPLSTNTWYHVVAVRRGNSIEIYVNGELHNSTASNRSIPINNVHIGKRYIDLSTWYHAGNLDEIRIWNHALSQAEIRDWMCKKINNSHPRFTSLVAHYNFDQGSGSILTDFSGNGNSGTLINGPAWQLSGAPLGDESIHHYSSNPAVGLSHADGDHLSVSSFTGSPSGVHIYRIDDYPNTLSGTNGVGNNNKYFGVYKVGDPSSTYTVVYDYTGNPGVGGDESNLKLYKRTDNSAATWTDAGASLNTTSNTLTVSGNLTEYILGSSGSPLPVEVMNFNLEQQINQQITIFWQTASEFNNDYFTVEKSADGSIWSLVDRIKGAGTSNKLISYQVFDDFPGSGIYYYRLKQTDYDGKSSIVSLKKIKLDHFEADKVYPNPAVNHLSIEISEEYPLKLFIANGQDLTPMVEFIFRSDSKITLDISSLEPGLYFVRTKSKIHKFYKL